MYHGLITIHALSPIVQYEGQPLVSDSDADRQDAVLSRGRAIVHAGCEPAGWQTPKARESPEFLSKNAYTYLPVPPLVPVAAALALKHQTTLKEWDTPLSESEKFSTATADLEPFEGTSFCSLLPHANDHPSGGPAIPNSSKQGRSRRSGTSSPSRPPAKRMRAAAELDTRPLGELIPLPHYIPALLKSSHLASVPLDVRYSSFVPVPPKTASSIEALFSSTYARVAWLIPVRGLPPWDGVSGAYVALPVGDRSSIRMPVPGPAKGQSSSSSTGGSGDPNSDIVWTHASLRQFWSFLRSRSETPGAVTGPLSLSFWAAPRSEHPESQRGTVSSAAAVLADLPANRETEMTPSNLSPSVPISPALKSRLADIDYVKVYCDAPRAMLVREALGQWVYKGDVLADVEDLRAATVTRILEYAKLILVNERGEGVLVS